MWHLRVDLQGLMVLTVSTLLSELGENFVSEISNLRVNLRKSSQALGLNPLY